MKYTLLCVGCLTTDNGANIVCVLNRHLVRPWLPCFGHNLHLAVTNPVKNDDRVKRALGIHMPQDRQHILIQLEEERFGSSAAIDESSSTFLKSDCSTQMMIDTILEQKDALRQVL